MNRADFTRTSVTGQSNSILIKFLLSAPKEVFTSKIVGYFLTEWCINFQILRGKSKVFVPNSYPVESNEMFEWRLFGTEGHGWGRECRSRLDLSMAADGRPGTPARHISDCGNSHIVGTGQEHKEFLLKRFDTPLLCNNYFEMTRNKGRNWASWHPQMLLGYLMSH